jgi:hypothetical protein
MSTTLATTLTMGLARYGGQLSYVPAAWTRYEQMGFVAARPLSGDFGPPYVVTLTQAGMQALSPLAQASSRS